MRVCSKCNRTYKDDSLALCFYDGTRLTPVNDPAATLRASSPANTNPPRTEVFQSPTKPPQQPPPQRPIAAFPSQPFRNQARSYATDESGGKKWFLLGGVLTLVGFGTGNKRDTAWDLLSTRMTEMLVRTADSHLRIVTLGDLRLIDH